MLDKSQNDNEQVASLRLITTLTLCTTHICCTCTQYAKVFTHLDYDASD